MCPYPSNCNSDSCLVWEDCGVINNEYLHTRYSHPIMSSDSASSAVELSNAYARLDGGSVDGAAGVEVVSRAEQSPQLSSVPPPSPPPNTADPSICDTLCSAILSVPGAPAEGVESSVQADIELGNGGSSNGKGSGSINGHGYFSLPPSVSGESLFRGRRRLGLKWSGMNFSLKAKSRRRILRDCWGSVDGGQLCAILGPSGSGHHHPVYNVSYDYY